MDVYFENKKYTGDGDLSNNLEFPLYGKKVVDDGNYFSIVVGENGVGKSRLLREIFDVAYSEMRGSSRTSEKRFEKPSGHIDLAESADGSYIWPPSRIIALSGVATDKFMVRRQLSPGNFLLHDSDEYLYVGPKSEGSIVSRKFSIRLLATELLKRSHRTNTRRGSIKAAFDLLHFGDGILFTFSAIKVFSRFESAPRIVLTSDGLLKRIEHSIVRSNKQLQSVKRLSEEVKNLVQDTEFLSACNEILNFNGKAEWLIDLSDSENNSSNKVYREALRVLLLLRYIDVDETYVLTKGNSKLSLSKMSSGQWQIFASLLLTAYAVEDNCLILVDEPENSLHPLWQQLYLTSLDRAISSVKGVHVIVATHSPLIAASLPNEKTDVCAVKRVSDVSVRARLLESNTYGWTADDILKEVFLLGTTRSIEFNQSMEKALKFIGEGKTESKALIKLLEKLNNVEPHLQEDDIAKQIIRTMNALVTKQGKT